MIYDSNSLEMILQNQHPVYQFFDDVDLQDIKEFVVRRHRRNGSEVCIHELGVGHYRFDFVSLNPYSHKIRIFEYKVSKADFLGDCKWRGYLGYCTTFSFVTPLGLVSLVDLPKGVGLLQVFRWRRRVQQDQRRYLGAIWVRRPGGRKLPEDTYRQVADMMLARLVQGRKDDFF